MADRSKLLLHVGVHYTGAAYIRDALQALGHELASMENGHFFLSPVTADQIVGLLRQNSELETGEGVKTIVVIDEALACREDFLALAPIADHYECKVSVFLIRQDIWLESDYIQHVISLGDKGHEVSFEAYLRQKDFSECLDYGRMLDRWAQVVGRENLLVQPLESAVKLSEVFGMFARSLGLQLPHGWLAPAGDRLLHVGCSPQLLYLARMLNFGRYSGDQNRVLLSKLIEMQSKLPGARRVVDGVSVAKIIERYEPSNKYVENTYCRRNERELFENPRDREQIEAVGDVSDPAEFTFRYIEPLLSLLDEHLVGARATARQKGEAPKHEKQRISQEISDLETERRELEHTLSTSREILVQLSRWIKSTMWR